MDTEPTTQPESTQPNGSGKGQTFDEVVAETVEITQGGAGVVQADTVSITQGGAQMVEAKNVTVTQGGAFAITGETTKLKESGAAIVSADTVHLDSAAAFLTITDTLKAKKTTIGILFAGTIEGQPDVKIDARTAAAIGAGAGLTLFLLKRIFSRS